MFNEAWPIPVMPVSSGNIGMYCYYFYDRFIWLRHIVMARGRGLSVWVCSRHTRIERGRHRGREICCFSWLQASAENFPSSPPLPAPTSCLHYSRVFQGTPVTVGSRRPVETHRTRVVPLCPSSPAVADHWYGLLRVRSPSCARCR